MPYKTYELGDEGKTARLLIQYDESDAMDEGLLQY